MNQRPEKSDSIEINGVRFTFNDIHEVVSRFYTKVEHDEVLKVPFATVHDWPVHIDRLTHFWWTRLSGSRYLDVTYNPVEKHFEAGFNDEFLQRWLNLFGETMRSALNEDQATLWLAIAMRMGQALGFKNEMYRQMVEQKGRA